MCPVPSRKAEPKAAATPEMFLSADPAIFEIMQFQETAITRRIVNFSGKHDKQERFPEARKKALNVKALPLLSGIFGRTGVCARPFRGAFPIYFRGDYSGEQCCQMTKNPGRGMLPGCRSAANGLIGQLFAAAAVIVIVLFDLLLPASGRSSDSFCGSHGFHGEVHHGIIVGADSGSGIFIRPSPDAR